MNLYVYLQGGIGNQMFQYARGLQILKEYPDDFDSLVLDTSFYENQKRGIIKNGLTGRTYDLDVFNITHTTTGKAWSNRNTLHGYFQSKNYFLDVVNEVKEEFDFAIEFTKKTNRLAKEINSKEHTTSIHVRRGDYVNNPTATAHHGVM